MSTNVRKSPLRRLWDAVKRLPEGAWQYAAGKLASGVQSYKLHQEAVPLDWDDASADAVIRGKPSPQPAASERELRLVRDIEAETRRLNRNNVTRTDAYYRMYRRFPELHWALLAHMVSRNGGWNMTDLRGSMLPRLLTRRQADDLFRFLERANALIFQDAYPQLALYRESVRLERPLFHLLPRFHVSAFMRPAWEAFWSRRSSSVLTVALIINEQQYIESRVVRNEHFRRTVLDTPMFKAQSWLQLNQVVFPYVAAGGGRARLAGLALENFSDAAERIEFGKALYAMLFGAPDVLEGCLRFAAAAPHTGSRADYWPDLFAKVNPDPPGEPFAAKLDGCRLRPRATRLYSPELRDAWPDSPVAPPERFDWYPSPIARRHVKCPRLPASIEMTNEYCFALNKIELAVLGAQTI